MRSPGGFFRFLFFFLLNFWCSPSKNFLPIDGVEVGDLAGLGRNNSVVEGGWRRRAGV